MSVGSQKCEAALILDAHFRSIRKIIKIKYRHKIRAGTNKMSLEHACETQSMLGPRLGEVTRCRRMNADGGIIAMASFYGNACFVTRHVLA
jgi:hypothetical protein